MHLLWGRHTGEMRLGRPENTGYNRHNCYKLTPHVGESLRDSHSAVVGLSRDELS